MDDKKGKDLLKDESIYLSPIQKYSIYKAFPYSFVIHILLMLGTTYQIIKLNTIYPRAQERIFYNMFISDSDKTALDFLRFKYLFSIDDIREHISNSISSYFDYPTWSLENTSIVLEKQDLMVPYLSAEYIRALDEDIGKRDYLFPLNESYLGPFDSDTEAQAFVSHVKSFTINYTIYNYIPVGFADHIECYCWTIDQFYDFQLRGHFEVSLKIKRNTCGGMEGDLLENFFAKSIWLHLSIFTLAVISLLLTLHHYYERYKKYYIAKKEKKPNVKFEFDLWSAVALSGNIIQIFGSGLIIFDNDNINLTTEITTALGCAFAYINISKYMENLKNYSMIFLTIKKGLPNSIHYLIGVLPLFLGYAFFGICVFWESERFGKIWGSIAVLFSVMYGDSVLLIIDDLTRKSYFLGTFYIYSYCILFIAIIINTFFSIISEAFVSRVDSKNKHWVYSFLQLEAKGKTDQTPEEEEHIFQEEIREEDVTKACEDLKRDFNKMEQIIGVIEGSATTITKAKIKSKFYDKIIGLERRLNKIKGGF